MNVGSTNYNKIEIAITKYFDEWAHLAAVVEDEGVLEVAGVVQRLGFDVDGPHVPLVSLEHLRSIF
jgi:hypothetical protein